MKIQPPWKNQRNPRGNQVPYVLHDISVSCITFTKIAPLREIMSFVEYYNIYCINVIQYYMSLW